LSNGSRGQSPWIETGGREIERKKKEQWGTGSKVEQLGETNIAMTTSVAKEAENASTADNNRAYLL